jgi:hypothetical protein
MDSPSIWNEYPPGLLEEADAARAAAEAKLVIAPDPYNVPFPQLLRLWMARHFKR